MEIGVKIDRMYITFTKSLPISIFVICKKSRNTKSYKILIFYEDLVISVLEFNDYKKTKKQNKKKNTSTHFLLTAFLYEPFW